MHWVMMHLPRGWELRWDLFVSFPPFLMPQSRIFHNIFWCQNLKYFRTYSDATVSNILEKYSDAKVSNILDNILMPKFQIFQKMFWCQSLNLKYFRKYSRRKSLAQLLRSNWGIRNARCCARHIRQAALKWGDIQHLIDVPHRIANLQPKLNQIDTRG